MVDRVFPVIDTPSRQIPVREVEEEEPAAITPPPPWRSPPAPERSVKFQDPEAMILTPAPSFRKLVNNYGGRRCNSCCLSLLAFFSFIVTSTVIFVGILFLVKEPKAPKFSIDKFSIHGFDFTPSASSRDYSPVIDLAVTMYDHNKMIGIDYKKENLVTIAHFGIELGRGHVLPAGYLPAKNKTAFQIRLKGSNVVLRLADCKVLKGEVVKKDIPLRLDLKIPIIMNFGSMKTWTMMVKGHCYFEVDSLSNDASIVSNKCYSSVTPWR